MSDHRLEDAVLIAVRGARPAAPPDGDSPFSAEAQAVRERAVAAQDRGRARPARAPAGRPRRLPTAGAILVALLAVGGVAVGVLAVVLLKHRPPVTQVRPAHAPPGGTASSPISGAPGIDVHSFVIPSTAKLVAEAPDPHGGLPWGVREVRTSRGQACLVVGRVRDGVVGVIGQDGAWANDHRFHPLPINGTGVVNQYCGDTDGNGNAFLNVTDYAAIASAFGDVATNGSAHGAAARVKLCPASSRTGRIENAPPPPCPKGDLRDLAYGLLGPDALSITYLGAGGRHYTEPTHGADGAYLIVGPQTKPPCPQRSAGVQLICGAVGSVDPRLGPGVVTAVSYRDGRVCHLPAPTPRGAVAEASCPLLGYRSPPFEHVTEAQVAAPVTARVLRARHYCNATGPSFPGCRQIVLDIAFTARIAVANLNSYYEGIVDMPPRHYRPGGRTGCPGAGQSVGPTQINIRAGQRIRWQAVQGSFPRDCTGSVMRVTIAYVANSYLGLNGLGSRPFPSPGRGATIVGRTSVVVP